VLQSIDDEYQKFEQVQKKDEEDFNKTLDDLDDFFLNDDPTKDDNVIAREAAIASLIPSHRGPITAS
jgi:hypothetical protein